MSITSVAVFIGSLRKDSFSRQLATALAGIAPASLRFKTVEIAELPFYNPDLDEGQPPAAWSAFRDAVRDVDALLFLTPEYNRSMPAALKNALDVGSRPYGEGVWAGKPGAVISLSPGSIGGFGANHHLRQTLAALEIATLPKEVYLAGADQLFDGQGFAKEGTARFLRGVLNDFAQWIERNRKP